VWEPEPDTHDRLRQAIDLALRTEMPLLGTTTAGPLQDSSEVQD
jgi:hypothetical protein